MSGPAERLMVGGKRAPNGCLEWQGNRSRTGYGLISVARKKTSVHRLAWQLAHGPIASGLCVCHHCDNRACFEVSHLFVAPQAVNVADMIAKGRDADQTGASNGNAKLSEVEVLAIRHSHLPERVLARQFCVGKACIHKIKKGRTWAHLSEDPQRKLDLGDD